MRRKLKIKRIIIAISFIILLPVSIYLILTNIDLDNYEVIMSYTEKSDTDYQVYLKENEYFKQEYLDKNQSYITSLIDYIDINFKYNFDSSKPFDHNYTYWVEGVLKANVRGDEDKLLWQQEYELVPKKTVKDLKDNHFDITEQLKIDYNEYNQLVNNFKQDYVLAVDAQLDVKLHVQIDGQIEKEAVENTSVAEITIPLSEQTIEIMMNYTEINNNDLIKNDKLQIIKNYFLFSLGLIIMLGIIVYIFILAHLYGKKLSKYEKTLKRILTKYNPIIINTTNQINLKDYKKFAVETFEELVDAQNELRIPISYFNKSNKLKKEAWFVLIHEQQAWYYVLRSDPNEEN